MCKFCEEGAEFDIKPCGNGDLKVRATYSNEHIILFKDFDVASGFIDINFCPMCGRKIRKDNNL